MGNSIKVQYIGKEKTGNKVNPYKNDIPFMAYGGNTIDPEKAMSFLRDGSIYGKPLSEKQIQAFSQAAGVDLDEDGNPILDDQVDEDQGDQEFMYGGQNRLPRGATRKNIKTSINSVMARNETIFGPQGKHYYNPYYKEQGGETMKKKFSTPPTAEEFFSYGPPTPGQSFYKEGGPFTTTNGIAFPQQPPANVFFAGADWQSHLQFGDGGPKEPQLDYPMYHQRVVDGKPTYWKGQFHGTKSAWSTMNKNPMEFVPNAQPISPEEYNQNMGTGNMMKTYIAGNAPQQQIPFNPGTLAVQAYGGQPCMECGGMHYANGGDTFGDGEMPEFKKGGHWIQGAVNPAHKGYCTPMTKPTCTGKRRAFAETMKKHHGFHKKALGGDTNVPGEDQGNYLKKQNASFMDYVNDNHMHAMMQEELAGLPNGAHEMMSHMAYGGPGGGKRVAEPNPNYTADSMATVNYAQQHPELYDFNKMKWSTNPDGTTLYKQPIVNGKDGRKVIVPFGKGSKMTAEDERAIKWHINERATNDSGQQQYPNIFGLPPQKFGGTTNLNKFVKGGPGNGPCSDTDKMNKMSPCYDPNFRPREVSYATEGSSENDAFWGTQQAQDRSTMTPAMTQPGNGNGNTMDQGMGNANSMQTFPMITNQDLGNRSSAQPSMEINPVNTPQQWEMHQRNVGPSGETKANWLLAGLSGAASMFEARDRKKQEAWMKQHQGSDAQFYNMNAGNRGTYDMEQGQFRPNSMTPVQQQGNPYGQMGSPNAGFKQGGEYYLTDDEVNHILKNGGQIEYLD